MVFSAVLLRLNQSLSLLEMLDSVLFRIGFPQTSHGDTTSFSPAIRIAEVLLLLTFTSIWFAEAYFQQQSLAG